MILLESKSYILIHHTFTRSACIHVTTGKHGFKSHFLHLVFIEIDLIFNSYDIVMTGYMHYNVSFMCPEWLCIFLLGHIYHLLTSKKSPVMHWFRTPDHSGSSACRALADCATTALSKTRYWLSIYEHIHLFWDWNNT